MHSDFKIVNCGLWFFLFVILLSGNNSQDITDENPAFIKAELAWRDTRDQEMRDSTSWLTIAGLYWLKEGENTFGTDAENNIRLPEGSAPPFSGAFILRDGNVKIISAEGIKLTIEGNPIKEKTLKSDETGKPDVIELNDLRIWVIKRGDRLAVRLRDFNAARYKDYSGLDFFLPREKYRIKAVFIPYSSPKTEILTTVVGTEAPMKVPGYISFRLDGKDYRLDTFEMKSNSKTLFIIFKDETNGNETYGASRFMNTTILDDGSVDLNFNRAHNPPCAYTPYATCPLPPPQNILPVRIEAGEKLYRQGH
jgi:uncharacterized protein (DUF1684 family)